MKRIENVSIIGMGALGILYGNFFSGAIGNENVHFIMDKERCERKKGRPVLCNGKEVFFDCVPAENARAADLLIVAVKATGLAQAIDSVRGCVGPDTIIISVMNGISSEELIAERYGKEHVLIAVAQGMDAMRFGDSLTFTKTGQLLIGTDLPENLGILESLCEFFDRTGFPYTKDPDIIHRLWGKFMLNVGVNQTCMVCSCTYADVLRPGRERDIYLNAMYEVIAIANVKGIALSQKEIDEYDQLIATLRPEGTPSMGQDRINRRPSEVESFAGTVIRLGAETKIPTPVNQWLYDQVRQIESGY